MTTTPALLLDVKGLDTFYGRSQILFGLGLAVARGESVALLGRNGAGKSTTMKSIMRLAPPRRGTVQAMGQDVSRLRPDQIANLGLGYVPEDRQIFKLQTVDGNLRLGMKRGPQGQDEWPLERLYALFPLLADARPGPPDCSRAASSRCWPSPARWRATPNCCCSTNPARAWRP